MSIADTTITRKAQAIAAPANLAFLWLGGLFGLYLVEFPARFGSDEATFGAALDIGRLLFQRLSIMESGLLILTALSAAWVRPSRWVWAALVIIALVHVAQASWLLPELSARSIAIVGGADPGSSSAHAIYGYLEIAKGSGLLAIAFLSRP